MSQEKAALWQVSCGKGGFPGGASEGALALALGGPQAQQQRLVSWPVFRGVGWGRVLRASEPVCTWAFLRCLSLGDVDTCECKDKAGFLFMLGTAGWPVTSSVLILSPWR